MSIETVQFTEMIRQAYAALAENSTRRVCPVCEAETTHKTSETETECLVCGYKMAMEAKHE